MEHSEIIAWGIEGRPAQFGSAGSQPSANRPVEVGQCSATDAGCHQSRPDWQPNLCIVCMRLFGNRPFRRINCECQCVPLWSGSPPSRPITPAASLAPPARSKLEGLLRANRGQSQRGVYIRGAACSMDDQISGHRSQSLSSYTFVQSKHVAVAPRLDKRESSRTISVASWKLLAITGLAKCQIANQ